MNDHIEWMISKLYGYEKKKLFTSENETVAYHLDGKWQVRKWTDVGFYAGELIFSCEDAVSMVAWLHSHDCGLTLLTADAGKRAAKA